MKTKQVNEKRTVKCSHNEEYQYTKWHTETTGGTDMRELDQYVDKFAEYNYDLCDKCMNIVVNGLAVGSWIAIEKSLVWSIMVHRSHILDATEMMKQEPSKSDRLERDRNKTYHVMVYHQEIIKQIRQAMVSQISGE